MSPDRALPESTLRRLLHAGQALVSRHEVDEVIREVLEIAAEVTAARYVAVGVLNPERTTLERFLTRGVDEETHQAIGDLPRGRGVLGVLIDDPRPLRLADVGDHPKSYGFPAGHPPMRGFLGVPVFIRGEAWGNLYLTEKAGGEEFTLDDEHAVEVLAIWVGIAIENARLYDDIKRRRDELERAVRGLEATTTIARAVGSESDLGRILELVVKRGRALIEARSLVLLLSDQGDLEVAAIAGQVSRDAIGARVPCEGTLAGAVVREGLPERVSDVPSRITLDEHALGVVGAETGLLVPLTYRGEHLGVLAAFDRLRGTPDFDSDDESLLSAFAASAATAVATARSVERRRLSQSLRAAEDERRRWARELHDETLQGLGGLQLALTSASRSADLETMRDALRGVSEQLGGEIANLRTLITELRPAALDELGLAPAITSLAGRVEAVEGIAISVELELGEQRLAPELETTVFRLVQEALTNVAKHAGAESARISVRRVAGEVVAEIADDGRGFDPERPAEGFGLVGMRERVALAGGELELHSAPGATRVHAVFPVA